jgi:hypothetical protein
MLSLEVDMNRVKELRLNGSNLEDLFEYLVLSYQQAYEVYHDENAHEHSRWRASGIIKMAVTSLEMMTRFDDAVVRDKSIAFFEKFERQASTLQIPSSELGS